MAGLLAEVAIPPDGAAYFPPAAGVYEMKPGLLPLDRELGNGPADRRVFQCDAAHAQYRQAKRRARAERLAKYYQTRDLAPEVAGAVCRFIAARLAEEHPDRFRLEARGGERLLHCAPSGETLRFDPAMGSVAGGEADPPYADPLDALASQVQEDLVVVRRAGERDWTAAIHLCCPYRWTAEEKIGLDFVTMHLPVPGMESFRKPGMVTNMVKHGPLVRFVWELATDARLNHHPEPPPGIPPAAWRMRPFDPARPRLLLRVEREVFWSFPALEAALMTIRVSFRDGEEIRSTPALREPFCATLESMSPELLDYKGLTESRDAILAWLRGGAG